MKKIVFNLQKMNAAARYETILRTHNLRQLQAEHLGRWDADPEHKYRQLHLYTYNRRTICYIAVYPHSVEVHTGRPSDASCLSWIYPNSPDGLNRAQRTAAEYANAWISF